MKALDLLVSRPVFFEIGHASLLVLDGEALLECPLERAENGRLTEAGKAALTTRLNPFLKRASWQPRARAWCALGARGVSLRRLTLPPAPNQELRRLLALQIEGEFPLPPEELAWGACPASPEAAAPAPADGGRDWVVAAVKREVLEDYAEVLSRCRLQPVFTLAALARAAICPQPPDVYAVLDIGPSHAELAVFRHGTPTALRVIPWGSARLLCALADTLSVSAEDAARLWNNLETADASAEPPARVQSALQAAVSALAAFLPVNDLGQKLYLTGADAPLRTLANRLAAALQQRLACEAVAPTPGRRGSAALEGLKHWAQRESRVPPLVLETRAAADAAALAQPARWPWAAAACGLGLVSLGLRYAEPWLKGPALERRLAQVQNQREALPRLDRELAFLQSLQQRRPPYLDALYVLADAAPRGARVQSLSMTRRGDLTLRATLMDSQQAVEFRAKLTDSGFFSSVVIEEQTPAPNQPQVSVRLSAQWKPAGARPPLAVKAPVERAPADRPGPRGPDAPPLPSNAPGTGRPAPHPTP